eukprot:1472089-Rhodomonas_salina.1
MDSGYRATRGTYYRGSEKIQVCRCFLLAEVEGDGEGPGGGKRGKAPGEMQGGQDSQRRRRT